MDGDPALIDEAKAKKKAKKEEAIALQALRREAKTPEQIRQRAEAGLFELAHEMMARTASVLKLAAGIREGRSMQGALRKYIQRLRSKLYPFEGSVNIISIPRVGYRLDESTQPVI